MNFAIYNTTTGEILRNVTCSYEQVTIQCGEKEEFYINCPSDATHIINNEPVIREEQEQEKTLEELKEIKIKYLASQRFFTETSGIPIGDSTILTDRESQSQLNSALNSLKEGFVTSVKWKGGNGIWTDITLTEVIQISTLVSQHVQRCFAREYELTQQVYNARSKSELDGIVWSLE